MTNPLRAASNFMIDVLGNLQAIKHEISTARLILDSEEMLPIRKVELLTPIIIRALDLLSAFLEE